MIVTVISHSFLEWNFVKNLPMQKQLAIHVDQYTSECFWALQYVKLAHAFSFQLNHFPGSFQIGRKDRLWRNLSKLQVQNGKKEFGFFPQTFVLPSDLKLLKRAWEDGGPKQKWIVKPVRGNLNDSNFEKHVVWFKNKLHENTPKLYLLNSSKITVHRIFLLFSKNIVNLNDFLWWVVMNEILCCYWMNSSSIVIEGNNSCLQCYDKKSIWENWGGGFPFVIFIKFLLNQWDEGVFC